MLSRLAARLQGLMVLAGLAALLGIAAPHFLTGENLLNILQQSSINALLGIGLTLVIISGGIDLSVGSLLALTGLVAADLSVRGVPLPLALGAALVLGLLCGAASGLVTTAARIPPFISTLGMMLVARSAAKIFSGSRPISGLGPTFSALAGDVLGVPLLVLIVLAFFILAHLALTRTRLGRYAYAIGGNEKAAWLAGISTVRYKVALYALSGLMAAVAGVLLTARLNAASPLMGEMYELYAIAAVVIGGTSLLGGEGHVLGTLIGALIMGVLRNGLNLLSVPAAWEGVVVGAVLVAAVVADRARHRGGRLRRPWTRLAAATAFAALALLASWHRAATAPATDLVVALVPKSIGNPFWAAMQRGAQAEGRRLGVRVMTLAAERETDVEGQHQIVENLVEQRVGAIVLAPAGSREIVPAVRKANRAGVPVVIVDSDIDRAAAAQAGASTLTYIGSDNVEGGRIAARSLARALGGTGTVAVLEGTPGHESTDRRRQGFADALRAYPAISIVASLTANGERERGYSVAQNILQSHPRLSAIFAANDEMALGAMEAVAAARRLGQVQVLGFDAAPDALKSIQAGRMLGSVAQYPSEMGRLAVLHAVQALRGGARPPAVVHTKVAMVDRANVAPLAADLN